MAKVNSSANEYLSLVMEDVHTIEELSRENQDSYYAQAAQIKRQMRACNVLIDLTNANTSRVRKILESEIDKNLTVMNRFLKAELTKVWSKKSGTKSAIARRKMRANETKSEKKKRLAKRRQAIARFEEMQGKPKKSAKPSPKAGKKAVSKKRRAAKSRARR